MGCLSSVNSAFSFVGLTCFHVFYGRCVSFVYLSADWNEVNIFIATWALCSDAKILAVMIFVDGFLSVVF